MKNRSATMTIVLLTLLGLAASCSGPAVPTSEQSPKHFLMAMRGIPSTEGDFVVATSDLAVIEKARAQLRLPESQRNLFLDGIVAGDNGGHNVGWSWHIAPDSWNLREETIELCDANPKMVEENIDTWVGSQFCPWGSYVLRELPPG